MLESIKARVLEANLELPKLDLVTFTWGNVSEYDPTSKLFVIKPSGVPYDKLTISDMVVCDLEGKVVEGHLNPSSDTPTHAYLYKVMPNLRGITHTHSIYASSWAQSGNDLFASGTTHADTFYGPVPCTQRIDFTKITKNYEYQTGIVIAQEFQKRQITWKEMPAILVNNHGPFTFGSSAMASVKNAKILEVVGQMALNTFLINGKSNQVNQALLDKHYNRKHGKNAYYGQPLKSKT